MRPLLILGDGHLAALQRGLDLDPGLPDGRAVQFHPFGPGSEAVNPFHTVAPDRSSVTTHAPGWRNLTLSSGSLDDVAGQGPIVAVSLPLNTTRILRGTSWIRHLPWSLQRDDSEFALSDQAVDAALQADYRHALDFVLALKSIGIEVLVIEAPRFFDHSPYLDHKRFDVCVEIDSRYRAQVRRQLDEAGIPIAGQPQESIAPEGGTQAAYRHENADDFLHAGADYGRLAMANLLTLAATMDG